MTESTDHCVRYDTSAVFTRKGRITRTVRHFFAFSSRFLSLREARRPMLADNSNAEFVALPIDLRFREGPLIVENKVSVAFFDDLMSFER